MNRSLFTKMRSLNLLLFLFAMVQFLSGCWPSHKKMKEERPIVQPAFASSFGNDVGFLKQYTDIIVLEEGNAMLALSPALQGRVMTSTANGTSGKGYGWINKGLFEAGDTLEHINAFGGEERFWLGPEGGQFSIFFKEGTEFTLDNWFTPKFIDLVRFDVVNATGNSVVFNKRAALTNYSGFTFDVDVTREVKLLSNTGIARGLGIDLDNEVKPVAYRSINTLKNAGSIPWKKETGLLSIWMLGMFNPSPGVTVVIPFIAGDQQELGPIVNDDYFGKVPGDRLEMTDGVIYFKGDGQYRSKIGLSPLRSKDVIGSYDEDNNILTILKYNKPVDVTDYVNSQWKIQQDPYAGDVINSYNDGPPAPGEEPLGPFYELETSSPAVALAPGESIEHIQYTFHFEGSTQALDRIAQQVLGVSLDDVAKAFD